MKHIFLILLLIPLSALSQYDPDAIKNDSVKSPKINPFEIRDKIYVGSGLNLMFGNTTFLYVSPQVGYDIFPKISAGFNTLYQFLYYKYSNTAALRVNTFGLGMFMRYRPFKQLILETSINHYWSDYNKIYKEQANSWMLGLGYARPIGNRSYTQFMIQYDLLKDWNVPEPYIIETLNWRLYYKFGFIFYLS
ncbi:MAG TPA: hypothetical protein EYG85_03405, partial [Crocinitomix sp.]|nr:hypothetical protein [Crocinitomix sp.]